MSWFAGQFCFDEMRLAARRLLPSGLFDYIDRGVGDEVALRALRTALDAVEIAPRVLHSNSSRSVECSLFGQSLAAPIIIAPTAMAGLIRNNGEVLLARAASRHGIPICLSTQSITSIEHLRAKVPSARIWLQLYLWQERDLSLELLKRAEASGASVLVMTVDTPYGARKEWNIRSGFDVPFRFSPRNVSEMCLHPRWVTGILSAILMNRGIPSLGNYPREMRPGLLGARTDARVRLRRDLRWDDVAWVRSHWKDKLVLKGIMTPEDAVAAEAAGVDGIVVSSHGARNFDAAPSPIDVVHTIAGAVGSQLTVLADSGVQRGVDVLRYRLRGAEAVMIGRLPLWALAAGGEAGLDNALTILKQEYLEALDFAGIEEG